MQECPYTLTEQKLKTGYYLYQFFIYDYDHNGTCVFDSSKVKNEFIRILTTYFGLSNSNWQNDSYAINELFEFICDSGEIFDVKFADLNDALQFRLYYSL